MIAPDDRFPEVSRYIEALDSWILDGICSYFGWALFLFVRRS